MCANFAGAQGNRVQQRPGMFRRVFRARVTSIEAYPETDNVPIPVRYRHRRTALPRGHIPSSPTRAIVLRVVGYRLRLRAASTKWLPRLALHPCARRRALRRVALIPHGVLPRPCLCRLRLMRRSSRLPRRLHQRPRAPRRSAPWRQSVQYPEWQGQEDSLQCPRRHRRRLR